MFYDHGYMAGMHLGWWLIWLAIGVGLFLLWQNKPGSGNAPPSSATPMDILQRRLASGEITAQEFEERAALLRKHAG